MGLIEGISARQLQASAIQALVEANTLCGQAVFEARDWPTDASLFPLMMVHVPQERKSGVGPGVPQFNSLLTLVVVARTLRRSPTPPLETEIRRLNEQVESALLCTPAFLRPIQRVVTVSTQLSVTSEGEYFMAEMGMMFELEVWQVYAPDDGVPLQTITGTLQVNGGTLAPMPTFKVSF